MQKTTLLLFLTLYLFGCNSPSENKAASKPTSKINYEKIVANDSKGDIYKCDCVEPRKFKFNCKDTLDLRFEAIEKFDYRKNLVELTESDRVRYLQGHRNGYQKSKLYFFSNLYCSERGKSITLLNIYKDDYTLIWLNYNSDSILNGIDTLLESYADGQAMQQEFAYYDAYQNLKIHRMSTETFMDGNDSMAYVIDTVVFDNNLVENNNENGHASNVGTIQYNLQRYENLTMIRHWIIQFPTNFPKKIKGESITKQIPAKVAIIGCATGDLNNDTWNDYVFVLEDTTTLNSERDLLIIFTGSSGFEKKLFLPKFIPSKDTGGFHDPFNGIKTENGAFTIAIFGGSAWKWESNSTYRYSDSLNNFFLVKQQNRSYHNPSVSLLSELPFYEEKIRKGIKLSKEENETYGELKKTEKDYEFITTVYTIGQKPLVKEN